MFVTDEINALRQLRWQNPELSWGFVPTMGYLHAGHIALVERARRENERVAVSIYVNPTQFAPTEDLSNYPRKIEADLALLKAAGVDLVYTPSDTTMYPAGFQTSIQLSGVTRPLEGASRPTHFGGVATIVAKLFNIVQPTRAYFGQKDAQQTVVLKQMVQDLNFNLDLVVCPIVREADGLAMSSRNSYLSPAERKAATVLHRALIAGEKAVRQGSTDGEMIKALMHSIIASEPLARLDYISAADPLTLEELASISNTVLLSLAVYIGKTRLIDNFLLSNIAVSTVA